MKNSEKYENAFKETFLIDAADLVGLKYQAIPAWDSVGHMALVAALEEAYDIELDIDDIIEFSGFEIGKVILGKYNISID